MTFESLGLSPEMLETLAKKGFEEPTPIQSLVIPKLLVSGGALAARARTGTGKTAAFGIPLVENLSRAAQGHAEGDTVTGHSTAANVGKKVSALILVPTRELAIQVTEEISTLKYADTPTLTCVYGGASITKQFRALKDGVDIVVGTPGRVLDHMERGTLNISAIDYLVLDEADEMLDMGFIDDITKVMDTMNPAARIMLFSATLSAPVLSIVKARTGSIEIVEDAEEILPTELAEQVWIEVLERDRIEALSRIIDSEDDFYGIVFVATKVEADTVARRLAERGYQVEALHGDLTQEARERVLGKFRDKRVTVLVATDVAARGIDIEKLTHVINWELPHDSDEYLHRIGRTGRAGNTGTAITFVTPDEYHRLFRIKKVSGKKLKKGSVPEIQSILDAQKDRIEARILERADRTNGEPSDAPLSSAASTVDAEDGQDVSDSMWLSFAKELLAKLPPEEALAAALAEGFASQLNPEKYRDITEISVDDTGITRLSIGAGRKDGLNPRSLVSRLKKLSGLSDRQIGSVEVYNDFSFVTVPYREAERIIALARAKGGVPKVMLADAKEVGGRKGSQSGELYGGRRHSSRSGEWHGNRNRERFSSATVKNKPKAVTDSHDHDHDHDHDHVRGHRVESTASRTYKPRKERKAKKQ
jgi:ATP-dependent RNA helicase DeaD